MGRTLQPGLTGGCSTPVWKAKLLEAPNPLSLGSVKTHGAVYTSFLLCNMKTPSFRSNPLRATLGCVQKQTVVSDLNSGNQGDYSVVSQTLLDADLSLVRCQLDACPMFNSKQMTVPNPTVFPSALPSGRLPPARWPLAANVAAAATITFHVTLN